MAEYGMKSEEVQHALDTIQQKYDEIVERFQADWEAFDQGMAETWYSNTAKQMMESFAETLAGVFPGPTSNVNEYFDSLCQNIVNKQNEIAEANQTDAISFSFSEQSPTYSTNVEEKRSDGFEGVVPDNQEAAAQSFLQLVEDITSSMSEIQNTATGFIDEGVADDKFQTNLQSNSETLNNAVQEMSDQMSKVFNNVSEATQNKLSSIEF